MWDVIEKNKWKDVSFISGRAATEQDVKDGRAVFYIPSGSEPYEAELPLFAIHLDESNGEKTPCVVIQIEKTPEGTTVGVRYFDGGNGVGMATEFEFYNEIPNELNL